jgi:acetylornithine deacetylase/succinyl-diaminopimelate desuccinylase-like protein
LTDRGDAMGTVDWQKVQAEAVEHLRALVRIDTTNPPGDERPAADYVARVCEQAGLTVEVVESEPKRGNVVARMQGTGSARPLLLLSHLDVVPAEPSKWTHPPFAADVAEGYVWGRGAVDSKLTTAVGLMTLLLCARLGVPLKRDLILAATAAEEGGGPANGAAWLVRHRKDLIDAEYVINEGGGFPLEIGGKRFYVCQSAEKGGFQVDLVGKGTPGHASVPTDDNAIVHLAQAVGRLGAGRLGFHVTETARQFFERVAAAQDRREHAQLLRDMLEPEREPDAFMRLPTDKPTQLMCDAMLRNTAAPTMLNAGLKRNVIPSEARLSMSGRPLPGQTQQDFSRELREKVGDGVAIVEQTWRPGLESSSDTPLFGALERALRRSDPAGLVVPFLMTGGTDACRLGPLQATIYGFLPMRYEPGMAFFDLCHGHDERVSADSVGFGVRVLFDAVRELNNG